MDYVQTIDILLAENERLRKEIENLKEELQRYKNKKHSRNSSVPPSKDENRPFKSHSLREKTDKKPGGQPGHIGSTFKMVENPDQIVEHIPEYCSCCGKNLDGIPQELVEKRQITDIPEIRPIITEHCIYKKKCNCGHVTVSVTSEGIKNRMTYGHNIESLVGYFTARQYIPFKRMQELFSDIFNTGISEGGLHELLKRITIKAKPFWEQIKERIIESTYSGADETSARINGKKHWFWTWQNEFLTFITISNNRGFATIAKVFKKGLPGTILGHDCWKSYFQVNATTHQICIAHLLRELKYLSELYKNSWSDEFIQMLKFALNHKKQLKPTDYHQYQPKTKLIEDWLESLLNKPLNDSLKDLVVFQKRMIKYKPYIFTFLHHPEVPPDNNGSERAIRNVKVKQKISGQIKSDQGAMSFAVLRSIIDTARKNGQNALLALNAIANFSSS